MERKEEHTKQILLVLLILIIVISIVATYSAVNTIRAISTPQNIVIKPGGPDSPISGASIGVTILGNDKKGEKK